MLAEILMLRLEAAATNPWFVPIVLLAAKAR